MRLLLCLMVAATCAAGEDPLAGLQYADGVSRTRDDFHQHVLVVVQFCGHCPSAAAFMKNEVKALHDAIEAKKVPMSLICVTPDKSPAELTAYATSKGLTQAVFAHDPINPGKIGLQNILQVYGYGPDGREIQLGGAKGDAFVTETLASASAGKARFPVDNLSDPRALDLWWQVECGRPKAIATLAMAAKKSAIKDDAGRILAVVTPVFAARQDELVAAPATIATYEGIERLLREGEGLDLKAAQARGKELSKAPELKDELAARKIWQQCQVMAQSNKPTEQAAAKDNLAKLAAKFPDTAYGRLAAGR